MTAHPQALAMPRTRTRWIPRVRGPRKLVIGLSVCAFFLLIAAIGPLLVHNAAAISGDRLAPPSAAHLLGTTNTGQDVLSQLIVGARGSMTVGLLAGALILVLSVTVGMAGAMAGGLADEALSLLSNIFLVLPGLPLVILITDYIRAQGDLPIAVIIAITGWAGSSRVIRAQTLSLRQRDYIDAARVTGEPGWRIMLFEVLPNLAPILASQFVFAMIGGILTEAGLAFLGLSNINTVTWGSMLYFAQNAQALSLGAWWWFAPPGLCISLVGAALALVNFGLDELINPRLRAATPVKRKGARS
jgi:peptide/nickel transport system permease protein